MKKGRKFRPVHAFYLLLVGLCLGILFEDIYMLLGIIGLGIFYFGCEMCEQLKKGRK